MTTGEQLNDRASWIQNARNGFRPGKAGPCAICGRLSSITHAHHREPLSHQYDEHSGALPANHEVLWLCPNHHAIVHALLGARGQDPASRGRRASTVLTDAEKSGEDVSTILRMFFAGRA